MKYNFCMVKTISSYFSKENNNKIDKIFYVFINSGTPSTTCLSLIPRDPIEFVELMLGSEPLRIILTARQSYSMWFSQPDAAFLRFTFTVPTSARLALLGTQERTAIVDRIPYARSDQSGQVAEALQTGRTGLSNWPHMSFPTKHVSMISISNALNSPKRIFFSD